jgi:hypothetical protein
MAGASAPFTSIASMTAHYGPIAPPLDLSLFENGTHAKDFLLPFLRLGKLSSSDDKDASDRQGNHKHSEIDHLEHEENDDDLFLDHEQDHDDHLSYPNSHFHPNHFDSDDEEEDGYQSDNKMGIPTHLSYAPPLHLSSSSLFLIFFSSPFYDTP